MSGTITRLVRVEEGAKRMRSDLDEAILIQKRHEKALHSLATDKAKVVFGAWVANGLTCIFVAVMMFLAQRTLAAEAELFKQSVVREVRAANPNKVP